LFSTGKKVNKKNNKLEALFDLMMQSLEIKKSELEERRKDWESACEERRKDQEILERSEERLARSEEREQKLVDFMEILVKHIVQE
jgi:hypothetical protein